MKLPRIVRLLKFNWKVTIVCIFLSFQYTIESYGQVDASFEKAIDYIACQMVSVSLKKYEGDREPYEVFERLFLDQCTLEGDTQIPIQEIKAMLSEKGLDATVSLMQSIEDSKSNFSSTWEQSDINEYFEELLSGTEEPAINAFRDKHGTDYNNLQSDLLGALFVFIDEELTKQTSNTAETQAPSTSGSQGGQPGESSSIFNIFYDIIKTILLLGLFAFIYYAYRAYGDYQDIKKENEDLRAALAKAKGNMEKPEIHKTHRAPGTEKGNNEQNKKEGESDETNTESLEAAKEQQRKDEEEAQRVSKQEKAKNEAKDDQNDSSTSTPDFTDSKESSQAVSAPSPAKEHLYFSTPNADGSFKASFGSKVMKPSASMYHFTLQEPESKEASFKFISNLSTITDALNYPERYLDPVCEALTPINQNSKRITTIEEGHVRLEGDMWVLQKKAQIQYD